MAAGGRNLLAECGVCGRQAGDARATSSEVGSKVDVESQKAGEERKRRVL